MTNGSVPQPLSRRAPEVLVPFLGQIYFSLVLLYAIVSFGASGFTLIFVPFFILFLVCAYAVWRRSRPGFLATVILSGVFLVLEGTQIVEGFSAVTVPEEFFSVVTGVPALIAVLIYAILGLRLVWRKGTPLRPPRMIPASSFIALLIVGFVVGGIVVGLFAADTERRLIASAAGGDITIVQGAGNPASAEFYSPASFSAMVGDSVTWVNHDGTAHTVTSDGSSLFDSGVIRTGGTYSYTFSQAGTFNYYCTLHPWMKGAVVVTA